MDDIISIHIDDFNTSIFSEISNNLSINTHTGNEIYDSDEKFFDPPPLIPDNSTNLITPDNPDPFSLIQGIDSTENQNFSEPYPSDLFRVESNNIIGEQSSDMNHWHQQVLPDSCAIVCQEYILESFYPGQDFKESELVELADQDGYHFPEGGTLPSDVGRILEHYNIEVERSQGNTITDIINELENNKKIIVGVDANEIWSNSSTEQLKDLYLLPEANHAVQVIGYNYSQKEFILNDPGHPKGNSFHVSKSDFESAWQDSNNFMMVTKNAPPMT